MSHKKILCGVLLGGPVALLVIAAATGLLAYQNEPANQRREDQLWQHRNLGKAFYENPTTQAQAPLEFEKALALAPNSVQDQLNYGIALLRAMQPDKGIEILRKVQKEAPEIPHTWFNLGIMYKQRGNFTEAIEQLERMAQLVPDEPTTRFNLGVLYRHTGDTEKALSEFALASKLDPNFAAPEFQTYNTLRQADRTAEAEKSLARFMELKKRQDAEGIQEDTNWSFYSEIYEPGLSRPALQEETKAEPAFKVTRLADGLDSATAGMTVLNADGDHTIDLLVWSSKGVSLFKSGKQKVTSGLEALRDVRDIAAADFDNDGLADLAVVASKNVSLYKNAGRRFSKVNAVAPEIVAARRAVWLDFDHDYDLDLLLLGDKSILLRNIGEAKFEDQTAMFPFVDNPVEDAVILRRDPDTKGMDLLVTYANRSAVFYRDHLFGVYQAEPVDAVPAQASHLAIADINRDTRLDVVYLAGGGVSALLNRDKTWEAVPGAVQAGGGYTLADVWNRGIADVVGGKGAFAASGEGGFAANGRDAKLPQGTRWEAADFDGDGRVDLAVLTNAGALELAANETKNNFRWVRIGLAGTKNLKSGYSAEVEVRAGEHYQKRVYTGAPLTFGLREYRSIDAVRITWPSGAIQNEIRQATNRAYQYKEAPKLSGSCPMIFTWNGSGFEFLTDVLGVAPLGASAGDGGYFPVDHDEYVSIPRDALAQRDGRYEIRITEELSEVSYIDQVQLVAVDHPAEVEIFTGEKWKSPPFPEFRLYGATRHIPPSAARDQNGADVLGRVLITDKAYVDAFERDFRGVAQPHSLTLDFGKGSAPDNRAFLVLNGWVDWADGSTFLAESQKGAGLQPPSLQVKNGRGDWETVIPDMGMPSGKTKTITVDLTGKFLSASREVRIITNMCVYWDQVFMAADSSRPEALITRLNATDANLRFRGFSAVTLDPQRRKPEYFDYSRVRLTSTWNPTPGKYTRFGPVDDLLKAPEDRMVVMGSGDELELSFDAAKLPGLQQGWVRDFLLLVDGWAKDRDANTAFSQTVEPLPFHGMTGYPYPANEEYPSGPEYREFRKEWLTRPALRLIHPLVEARRR